MRISSGFFRVSSALILLCSTLAANTAFAGNYGVQVGAFTNVPAGFINKLEAFDTVTTLQGKSVTSIIVGSFDTMAGAKLTLATLENAGYTGAFVRDIDKAKGQPSVKGSTYTVDYNSRSDYGTKHPLENSPEKAKWDSLTPQEQVNTVILDGKLHFKQGDNFVPIGGSSLN